MKRNILCALLLMSGVWIVSCGQESGDSNTVVAPPGPQLSGGVNLDDLDYTILYGTLQAGMGGVLSENLPRSSGWPKNCRFTLVVPETSMSADYPIDFTMSIPTKQSYIDNPAIQDRLIIRFSPDGEQFSGPITVQGTWMPWLSIPDSLITTSGSDTVVPDTMTVVPGRIWVEFEVDHFSDWLTGPESTSGAPSEGEG